MSCALLDVYLLLMTTWPAATAAAAATQNVRDTMAYVLVCGGVGGGEGMCVSACVHKDNDLPGRLGRKNDIELCHCKQISLRSLCPCLSARADC